MLSKLLKYEIRATARIFLPLYAVLLTISAVYSLISLISPRQWQAPQVISMIVYVMVLVGVFVMTLVMMIQRFYKNLLSDEGYLMFTLPVEPWKHIIGKLLVSMMWVVFSVIAAAVSVCIVAYKEIFTVQFIEEMANGVKDILSQFDISTTLFTLEGLLICLIGLVSSVLIVYASIALGHLFNRHRILASLGAFIVLNTVTQILFVLAALPVQSFSAGDAVVRNFNTIEPIIHFTMWYIIVFFGLLSAGYFILTNHILSKRLNLE